MVSATDADQAETLTEEIVELRKQISNDLKEYCALIAKRRRLQNEEERLSYKLKRSGRERNLTK